MKRNFLKGLALAAMLFVGVSANAQVDKGYTAQPLSPELATLGQQVLDLQLSDPDKAFSVFQKMMKSIKSNNQKLIDVGEYFLKAKIYPCANMCAKQIYANDPKFIPGLFFSGQVAMLRKDYGGAGQKYDEILSYDPNNIAAMRANAFVYKNVNPAVAVEMLNKIKAIEPNNADVDKQLGDINYNLDKFKDAVENYKAYFANVKPENIDVRAAENYCLSLYSTADFFTLKTKAVEFAPLDPKDIIFPRMQFFADVNNYELDKAKESIKYLTEKRFADSLYIALDYEYAANYASENNDIPAAISDYKMAIQKDSNKASNYKELAMLYRRNHQPEDALTLFQQYLKLRGDKAEMTDSFRLGEIYAAASQEKSLSPEKKNEYFQAGDALFETIAARTPENYQPVLMRARINITDPSVPQDKVHELYEEVLKRAGKGEDVKSARTEADRYLIFYYINKDMLQDARRVTDDLLSIDPANAVGKNAESYLKQKGV